MTTRSKFISPVYSFRSSSETHDGIRLKNGTGFIDYTRKTQKNFKAHRKDGV